MSQTNQTLEIIRPDDWHIHLRDGDALQLTVPHAAKQFARAIVMPNLVPPVRTIEEAKAYQARIKGHIPAGVNFAPLMSLYLTDKTTVEDIEALRASKLVAGIKMYPAGATTNSEAGVSDIEGRYAVFAAMEAIGLPLLVHGEVTRGDVDVFDREKVFIDEIMRPIVKSFPKLKVVFEHITTKDAVDFVSGSSSAVAATITAHHLLYNRNALFQKGLRPHHYCLPVLKRELHRQALVEAATSGSSKFFLGTDSAPHNRAAKERDCGCAGIYTAFAAIELYAEVFDQAGALEQLEAFASLNGPQFYGVDVTKEKILLCKESWRAPDKFDYCGEELIPLRAGLEISWKLSDAR